MSSTDPTGNGRSGTDGHHGSASVEELLARAERVLRQPVRPPSRLTQLRWPLIGAGIVAVIVLVAALTSGGGSTVSGQTTAVPLASTTSAVATTVPIVITLPPNSSASATPTPASTEVPTSTITGDTSTNTTSKPATPRTTAFGVPARTITLKNGTLIVKGEVADQATADAIHSALVTSFGAAAVIDQLQIVSDAPFTDADPISAGTAVQFGDGQPTTDFASLRFLDQLADLLNRHPGVTADIHVTADHSGGVLARQRASVIRQYLVDHGIAVDRLTSNGDGDTGATAQLLVILHHLAG